MNKQKVVATEAIDGIDNLTTCEEVKKVYESSQFQQEFHPESSKDLFQRSELNCKAQKRVHKDESDLPGSAIVEACCQKCPTDGFDEILYFREDGTQILES